jgi:hypothetical protein
MMRCWLVISLLYVFVSVISAFSVGRWCSCDLGSGDSADVESLAIVRIKILHLEGESF